MTQSACNQRAMKTPPDSIERRLSAISYAAGRLSARRVLMPFIASLLLGTTLPALVFSATPQSAPHSNSAFSLSETCPASFELKDGGCILRNRYREYRSLRDAGVGGLKTGLPPLREATKCVIAIALFSHVASRSSKTPSLSKITAFSIICAYLLSLSVISVCMGVI